MPLTDAKYSILNNKLIKPLITSIHQDFSKLKSYGNPCMQLPNTLMAVLSDEASAISKLSSFKTLYNLTSETRESLLRLRYFYLNMNDEFFDYLPNTNALDIRIGVLQSLIEFMRSVDPEKPSPISPLPYQLKGMDRIRALFLQFMSMPDCSLERALLLTQITVEMENIELVPAFPSDTNFVHLIFICNVDGYFTGLDLSNLSFKSYPKFGYFANLHLKDCNLQGSSFEGFKFCNADFNSDHPGVVFKDCLFYSHELSPQPDLSITFSRKPRVPHLVKSLLSALATPAVVDEKKISNP